jgi:hypothetical protein
MMHLLDRILPPVFGTVSLDKIEAEYDIRVVVYREKTAK